MVLHCARKVACYVPLREPHGRVFRDFNVRHSPNSSNRWYESRIDGLTMQCTDRIDDDLGAVQSLVDCWWLLIQLQ